MASYSKGEALGTTTVVCSICGKPHFIIESDPPGIQAIRCPEDGSLKIVGLDGRALLPGDQGEGDIELIGL